MGSSVAEAVGSLLADLGVGHAFGVVGSGNFVVTNALRRHGVPFLAARHEGGAAAMADGWSRLADLPGVLTVHQGCGLTNAMTGIAEAAKSRTPMLVLAADTAGSAVNSNFRIDQDGLVASVGAVPERVHGAASLADDVIRAYRTAVHGHRTVVLNLPLDVQTEQMAADPSAPSLLTPTAVRPAGEAVEELAGVLTAARRPVFVAGRGARHAGPEIAAVARRCGALLATSAVANGLFAGDEFDCGISGGFASPLVAELITDADLIIGWGCALNMWTMRHGALIGPATTVVQIDDDPAAIGRHRSVDHGVVGDCRATAADLLAALPDHREGYRTAAVSRRLAERRWWNDTSTDDLGTADRIDPRQFSAALERILPAERVVAVDSGNFMGYPSAYLRVPDERGFCFTQAFQSVGLGLGSGIGAALSQPDRLPVIATGDGGFHMAVSELETAVRLGRPMLIAVYNDAAYGAEVHHFGEAADLAAVTFPDTDIAAVARGFGATGTTVRRPDDLSPIGRWTEHPDGVLVIDAKIVSDGGSWWLAEAFRGH
ncbi:thiamine pyrophosphate-binding protein [Microlunatus sp. Gsoil 973]|uniref:thiamine pyrophosphate-binding protein n=1 Tax=Microlunatus sp. Gsoil 973 TaxID=2672569 RepID=UPI0012B45004|nr:thiamine pyrophosphate-binding protein [Microlunatus sp. Gsoil 973]QGN32956.1 thiamine pyrophosphate-binding protein [Microlunatus sp. Gsoil 973]